jgi:nucleolar GTP-binding protein
MLLEHRVEMKLRSSKVDAVRHKINVAKPKSRDNKNRDICIPESVLNKRNAMIDDDEVLMVH